MSTIKASAAGNTFTVVSALGDSGTLTVRSRAGEVYEVEAFGDEGVRERSKTLSPGSTARLDLTTDGEPTLLGLGPGAPGGPFGAD